eukprot:213667-Amphidinium_carterae.1
MVYFAAAAPASTQRFKECVRAGSACKGFMLRRLFVCGCSLSGFVWCDVIGGASLVQVASHMSAVRPECSLSLPP